MSEKIYVLTESEMQKALDNGRQDAPHYLVIGEMEDVFVYAFNEMAASVHHTAVSKGWWKDREQLMKLAADFDSEHGYTDKNALLPFAEGAIKLSADMLTVTEIAEGVEGVRKGLQDDKVPEYTMEEAEAADAIIRLMDKGKYFALRIAEALVAKARMNKGRGHKHGGKLL